MEHWNEIRTAYAVARLGTVSAAATELDLHRATVIRHIDILEENLGVRLFQRHTRGYSPTESGVDLLAAAEIADEQLKQFAARTKARNTKVTGEIVVTSLGIVIPLVMNALNRFRMAHPDTTVRYVESGRVLNLACGEAHVAIRAGAKPTNPDNIVRPFFNLYSTLYAHRRYTDRFGLPKSVSEFSKHRFITHENPTRFPFFQWLEEQVDEQNIILRSQSQRVLHESVNMGFGIGFMPLFHGHLNPELIEVTPCQRDWFTPLWLVTHVDIHRTAKVRAISKALNTAIDTLPAAVLLPRFESIDDLNRVGEQSTAEQIR